NNNQNIKNSVSAEYDSLDPSKPSQAELHTTSELIDTGDDFQFNSKNIDSSSQAGGNPMG
ncbi:hypothetical protein ACFPDQ_05215, partial [Pseudofrancisella aestuarii]